MVSRHCKGKCHGTGRSGCNATCPCCPAVHQCVHAAAAAATWASATGAGTSTATPSAGAAAAIHCRRLTLLVLGCGCRIQCSTVRLRHSAAAWHPFNHVGQHAGAHSMSFNELQVAAGNPDAYAAASTGGSRSASSNNSGCSSCSCSGGSRRQSTNSTDVQPAVQSPAQVGSDGCGAVHLLPSLTPYGQCCLGWAQQLQDALSSCSEVSGNIFRDWVKAIGMRLANTPAIGTPLQDLTQKVQTWLQAGPVAAERQALGLKLQPPLQLLSSLQVQLANDAEQPDAEPKPKVIEKRQTALADALTEVGTVYSAVAVPAFCNNPSCSNVSGPTELQLVSGRSCMCAGCHTARYCCRDCQRQHWWQHKPVCKALAAVAAGGKSK